jgi:acetyl esterase/lipase
MKILLFAFGTLFAFGGLSAQQALWQPSAGHTQIAIWPATLSSFVVSTYSFPGAGCASGGVAGKPYVWVSNITKPSMTIYSPKGKNTGVAVVVFPGGGFEGLAIDLEGTEVCDWLTSDGITCVLLKYRVPSLPYDWHCK